jgi:hypothetical protein
MKDDSVVSVITSRSTSRSARRLRTTGLVCFRLDNGSITRITNIAGDGV